jgi:hypothetical protein
MRPLLLFLALLLSAPAHAWGDYAHRLTASLAWAQLTPPVRSELRRLMRAAPQLQTPECPAKSLEDLAYWPDCVRKLAPRFDYASSWHYQNISICQPFDIATKCENGQCITAQIPAQLDLLADRHRAPAERLQALAYFVHLMGDLHQPLHIGEKDDLGGNRVRASYGLKTGRYINLHGIWDTEMAERALTEPPAIRAKPSAPAVPSATPLPAQITAWAQESWTLSKTLAYPGLGPDGALCPATPSRPFTIDAAYITAATPALRTQVQNAGTRIAALLNQALGR